MNTGKPIAPFIQRYRIQVQEIRVVEVEKGKFVHEQGEWREHEIEVNINLERITRQMGTTAVRSRGGKSQDGSVVVTHIRH